MSRKANSMKNLIMNVISQLINIVCKFATRTVFIQTLGKQYLGINGLFSNIITMLSLAELGFGTAITFNLYKPLANKDNERIKSLMKLYKKVYSIIGYVILFAGICLLPFLPRLINGDVSFININFIFMLFLMQSVSSYLFYAYKSALIKADQKEYQVRTINYLFTVLSNVGQILILLIFKNFALYVATLIVFNIVQNLVIAAKVDKVYPYLKEKNIENISKKEIKEIFKDCYALFIYKVNGVIVNATDNIVLSKFIGLEIVGMYSNYLIIIDNLKLIVKMMYNAISASVGNLHATADTKHENHIFKVLNLATVWICGVASVGIFVVSNDLIQLWIGPDYVIAQSFSILLALDFYMWGIQMVLSTFRNAMGLFQQGKYRPLFGMIINIVVSVVLVQYCGIYGVLLGTVLSKLLTYMWYDPLIIYKHGFHMSVKEYYLKNIFYLITISLSAVVCYYISKVFVNVNLVKFVVMGGMCVAVTSLLLLVSNFKTKEFKYLYDIVIKVIDKIFKHKVVKAEK